MLEMMVTWPPALEKLRASVGIWTSTLESLAPAQTGEVAGELEALNYGALWFPEAWGRESFTSASLLLSSTSSMVIATGIASIWGRDAVNAANAAKTLTAAFDDRFVLGLGVSHQPLVERLRGHDYATPLRSMREYLLAMDAAPMFA
ncbi:MAG TPA: LLM class flavin-dependent oxidoreductase, partial [Acidimicrobiales bacterium]